ncbi:MAG: hypothetical protein U9Q83_08585, partial [Bacteroidota bacterium]|nr:hypothetical protein [Bacteroidota bacterium]
MKKIKILISLLFLSLISITNINSQINVDVGPSGDYADMTAFIDNIKSYAGETVIARIEAGTYIGQYIIDSIGHPGYPAQLTIEPLSTNPTFEAESGLALANNYIFLIRNSMYVTINNINFVNNNTLFSNVITFDYYLDYIDIQNCNFTNTSSAGVDTNKSIIYFTPTAANSAVIDIVENNFNNGSYGIYSNGAAIDLKIINNNFNDFDYCGIHLANPNFATINENIIVSTKTTGNQCGIEVDIIAPIHIRRNFIGLSGYTTNVGIACTNSDSAIIANNMISLDGDGTNQALQISNSYTDVVFNNIYIPYGNNNSVGLKLINCELESFVRNNIFDVYAGYIFDFDDAVYSGYNIFNFNPSNNFAKFNSGIVTDLYEWQNSHYMDYESLLGDPQYMSSTDLHTG